jgi:tripartite ATP-independent transporter DctP family solute receptor
MELKRLALIGALAFGGFAEAQTYKLRLSHPVNPQNTAHVALVKSAETVKQRSNGEIEITLFPSNVLGNPTQMQNLTRSGSIDIAADAAAALIQIEPAFGALEIPFTMRDSAHAYKVLDGEIGGKVLNTLGRHSLKGLSFLEGGWRTMTNSRKPILNPEDVKGLKIWTNGSPFLDAAFKALGANPSVLNIGELYSALETKAFDAQENPFSVLMGNKLFEVQKFVSLTNHGYTSFVIIMNKARFDSMLPPLQKVLVDALRESTVMQRELNQKEFQANIEVLKKAGLQVVENPDMGPFRQAVRDAVRETAKARLGSLEILDAREAVK